MSGTKSATKAKHKGKQSIGGRKPQATQDGKATQCQGLSSLQRTILQLAHKNCIAEERNPADESRESCDVSYTEVLIAFYSWEPKREVTLKTIVNSWTGETEGLSRDYHGNRFSKEKIGAAKYNAAMAALSRAFTRLAQRGLVRCMCGAQSQWTGGNLTTAGFDVAAALVKANG